MSDVEQLFSDLESILKKHSTPDEKEKIERLKEEYIKAKQYGSAGAVVAPISLVWYASRGGGSSLGSVALSVLGSLGVLSYIHYCTQVKGLEQELAKLHENADKRWREYQISTFAEEPQSRVYDFDIERRKKHL